MLKKSSQYEILQDTEAQRVVALEKNADLIWAFFVTNTQLTLQMRADFSEAKGEIFVLVSAGKADKSVITVNAEISASQVQLRIHLIALHREDAQVEMQGAISIAEGVHQVEAHLLEEVVLLDGAKYIALQPILKVASPDVKASHGAKIHRISSEYLFYLQSKGLSPDAAQQLMLQSYYQNIAEKLGQPVWLREALNNSVLLSRAKNPPT